MQEHPENKVRSLPLPADRRSDTALRDGAPLQQLDIDAISIGPHQMREEIDSEELEGLSQSIMQQGVVQPLVVRPLHGGGYELVAGERRLRAAQLAGLTRVPAVVRELSDQQALEVAIVENAQREDLNPVDEAHAYEMLTSRFGMSQTDIARRLGKSRVSITNALRLLHLAPEVLSLLRARELSAGHGRVLLMVEDFEEQNRLAAKAVREGLSVRALERLVAAGAIAEENGEEDEAERRQLERLERKVGELLDVPAKMRRDAQGRKRLELTFPSEAAWKRFLARIRE